MLRYERDENKNYYSVNSNFINAKLDMTSITFDYYLKGLEANIDLAATFVSPDGGFIAATQKALNYLQPFTDYTLALRTSF